MFAQYKLAIAAALLAAAFFSGWTIKGWRYEAAEKSAFEKAVSDANKASAALEQSIRTLEANKFIVQRELRHEIEKPVYNSCIIPSSGLQLYNESANPR